jgi:hypothetical protein
MKMKKILTMIVGGLFVLSLMDTAVLAAPSRRGRARPRRAPLRVTPRPVIINEPTLIRERTIERPIPQPAPTPAPAYSEKSSFGGQVVGLSAGYFGGIPSMAAEIWFRDIFDTAKLNLRTGARYAQGADADNVTRKNALVFLDGIFFLHDETNLKTYLGGGLNFLAYTTGQKSGSVGGELYLGLEAGSWHSGSFYVEAGYGDIRTGFSPSLKGLTVAIGYKTGM